MKILSKLAILPFLFLGFASEAQTETVAPTLKKLQQLYLSVGTGPAITNNENTHPFGGTYLVNFTGIIRSGTMFRLNLQNTRFIHSRETEPGAFTYLGANGYHSSFQNNQVQTSIALEVGKCKKLNNLMQFQALGGVSFNKISNLYFLRLFSESGSDMANVEYLPGLLLQAEAIFLPTQFAGLTLGTYYHYVPENSNGGLTLSLNIGRLRTKEIL